MKKLLGVMLVFAFAMTTVSFPRRTWDRHRHQKGTYYQFGLNLANCEITWNQAEGRRLGRLHPERLRGVQGPRTSWHRPVRRAGLVADRTDPVLKSIADKTKLVFPRTTKRSICLRAAMSGTSTSGNRPSRSGRGKRHLSHARLLFELSGVEPRDMYPPGRGSPGLLKQGKIDAMFYVAAFRQAVHEDVAAADGLALIPLRTRASSSSIPPCRSCKNV